MFCMKCGKSLDDHPPSAGPWLYTVKTDTGLYHGACLGVPDVAALVAENDRLRAMLAKSNADCPYCGLASSDMARCASGFPGCARADDILNGGCD